MGLIKKVAKGSLAVGTLGASVAVEKGAKHAAHGISGKVRTQADLTPEEVEAGILFKGMSHESGRNAVVTLYVDRIERVKERSRMSLSKADQDVELTPIRTVSSVRTEKDGLYTKVKIHATGNAIDFKFRHEHAALFREQIQQLILDYGKPNPVEAPVPQPAETPAPDALEQLKKLAELRDAGVVSPEDFEAKKTELLARL